MKQFFINYIKLITTAKHTNESQSRNTYQMSDYCSKDIKKTNK